MKKPFLLNLSFLLIAISSFSQQKYVKGLIITQSNDTIVCMVPSTLSFGDKIPIKNMSDGKRQIFPLQDIKYLANGNQVFENIKYKKGSKEINKLLWLELEGKLNLYGELKNAPDVRMHSPGLLLTHWYGLMTTRVIKKGDSTYFINENDFIGSVKPLIADAHDLVGKVEAGEYAYSNIKELIKEYNLLFEEAH